MRLCMFAPRDLQLERGWPGIIEGDTVVQVAAQTLQAFFTGGGTARRHAEYPLADVHLRAPVLRPPSVRDFYAFEQHVKTARASRGQDVPPEWYEIPVFYFTNPAAIYGPEDEIPYPPDTNELDYELEVAAIYRGQDVPPEWYEIPVFYFTNPAAIYGPEDEIPYPPDTNELDYELEVAA